MEQQLEQEWLQENANQLVHYRDKIGVCNIICFCQCQKHESIAVLLVKPRDKQSKHYKQPLFVLPGGKRDFRAFRQTEPCWDAIVREFQEEAEEDLNIFCKKKCRFFEETIQVDLDVNLVTDTELKEIVQTNRCKFISNTEKLQIDNRNLQQLKLQADIISSEGTLVGLRGTSVPTRADAKGGSSRPLFRESLQGSDERVYERSQDVDDTSQSSLEEVESEEEESKAQGTSQGRTQVTRKIRSYFIEIECSDLPDKTFGRFNLYEMTERKWFSLEFMIQQFKEQHQRDKYSMVINPKLFRCISRFGGKLVNIQQKQLQKLNFVYLNNQTAISLEEADTPIEQSSEPTQNYMNNLISRINKTHLLFARINNSIKKQPIVLQLGQDVLFI